VLPDTEGYPVALEDQWTIKGCGVPIPQQHQSEESGMTNKEHVDEILDFAIKCEEDAYDAYMELANLVNRPAMSQVFKDFANEELGHKNKLLSIKKKQQLAPATGKVADLKLSDYLVEVEPDEEIDYQAALVIAMKKEKAAFKMYTDLAATTSDENLKSVFLMLADEEAKHKLRFEIEYDDYVLREN